MKAKVCYEHNIWYDFACPACYEDSLLTRELTSEFLRGEFGYYGEDEEEDYDELYEEFLEQREEREWDDT